MNSLIPEVEKYVSGLYRSKLPHMYTYHSLSHTQRVVESIGELIEGEQIGEADAENLIIAGWFHDVGHINGHEDHEDKSKIIAEAYLKEQGIDGERIAQISNLITATKIDHVPNNTLEKIMKDFVVEIILCGKHCLAALSQINAFIRLKIAKH